MIPPHFEELRHSGQLPSPSGVGMRVLVQTQKEDCSLDELVYTIQADPALTGRILKLANSARSGGAASIANLKDAAMRVGLRTVSNVALGFSLVSGNRRGKCEFFDYDHYWSFSLANAVAAQALTEHTTKVVPAEAFTCALLSRVGRLALASVHPTKYGEIIAGLKETGEGNLTDIERECFQIDNREVTAAMLADWGLPESFGEAVLLADEPLEDGDFDGSTESATHELVRILRISTRLAALCLADRGERHHHWAELKGHFEPLGLEGPAIRKLCDGVFSGWKEWGKLLSVPTKDVQPVAILERGLEGAKVPRPDQKEDPPGMRVLAVDDDPISLRLLVRHLGRAGHTVYVAKNGEEALSVALESSPQIVVADWMMPKMDGLELCKALRKFPEGRTIYFILLTGQDEEDRIVEAFEAGVNDYVVKPFKPKLLVARIQAGLLAVSLQDDLDREKHALKEQLNENEKLKRKFRNAAFTDFLTELPNRRYAMDRLEAEWATVKRSGKAFSVIMFDIDHFKAVNDNHGHDVGDLVLKETANAVQRTLRRSDFCARIGGEEFLVLCPGADERIAAELAERIRATVEANKVEAAGFDGGVTISLGVGTCTPAVEGIDALLKAADDAVYRAKRSGRNRVEVNRPFGDRESA